jgi:simple sugar transport system ATP-binding protein
VTPTGAASGEVPALALSEISKHFGSVAALENVSFFVRAGTVHALVGENGAGKTTLMRIAFGLIASDSGTVTVGHSGAQIRSAAEAIEAGVGMVHQHFTNVPAMTVAENVALGGRRRLSMADTSRRIADIGRRSGLVLDPEARAAELSVSGQQRLEIVKALARNARTLILDEPTAVLAPAEAEELLRWLRQFADDGNAVVLITHKLHEALGIADDVTVLRRGRVALHAAADALTPERLVHAMLGADLSPESSASIDRSPGRVVVLAAGVDVLNDRGRVAVRNLNLSIHAGEILGIAAIEGAGQRELLRALAGRATRRCKANCNCRSRSASFQKTASVMRWFLASRSLENVALKGAGRRRGRLTPGRIRDHTSKLLREFDVRGGSAESAASNLSGGNQQKFVLARELDGEPELLVVENPTRGLDIRAAAAVRERLRALRRRERVSWCSRATWTKCWRWQSESSSFTVGQRRSARETERLSVRRCSGCRGVRGDGDGDGGRLQPREQLEVRHRLELRRRLELRQPLEPRDLPAPHWKTSELFGRESPGKFPCSLISVENN